MPGLGMLSSKVLLKVIAWLAARQTLKKDRVGLRPARQR